MMKRIEKWLRNIIWEEAQRASGSASMNNDIDERLKAALETIIKDGEFISHNQFLVHITEHFDPAFAENPIRARIDDAVEQIKAVLKEAGYIPHLSAYHDAYLGAIKKEAGLMTGQEWLSKMLKAVHAFQTGRDYFRSDEKFRASTITMAELEALLKQVAGLEK